MLVVPRKVPINWYRYDVSFSIGLLRAYVDGVESQVRRSIEDFKAGQKVVIDDGGTEEGRPVVVAYQGLDDTTWDLAGIFEHYFSNLQRPSALVTLFSFAERELDDLCELFQKEFGSRMELSDLKGGGIDRAVLYLEKVAGLRRDKSGNPWTEIKSVQKIRNLVVQSGAMLMYKDGSVREAERRYVQASPYLAGDKEVGIGEGYLSHVLDLFDELFRQIDSAIQPNDA